MLNAITPWILGLAVALGASTVVAASPPPNAVIARIHEADQADRRAADASTDPQARIDLMDADARRSAELKIEIEQHRLAAPEDFYRASVVFRHASSTEELGTALALAVAGMRAFPDDVALKQAHARAWDRLQMNAGTPQRYATQFIVVGSTLALYPLEASGLSEAERVSQGGLSDQEIRDEVAAWRASHPPEPPKPPAPKAPEPALIPLAIDKAFFTRLLDDDHLAVAQFLFARRDGIKPAGGTVIFVPQRREVLEAFVRDGPNYKSPGGPIDFRYVAGVDYGPVEEQAGEVKMEIALDMKIPFSLNPVIRPTVAFFLVGKRTASGAIQFERLEHAKL